MSLSKYQKLVTKASGEANYGTSIRGNIRGLWAGKIDVGSFIAMMDTTIRRGLTQAWYEGAESCGVRVSELTPEELQVLTMEIFNDAKYVARLANDIEAQSKKNGYKLGPLLSRAEMWTTRYGAVRAMAKSYACGDKKLKWVWNPIKEHCGDCMNLNGRVYRASIWRKYDLAPRMRKLACGGFRCGCVFEETSDIVTPGRPPSVM